MGMTCTSKIKVAQGKATKALLRKALLRIEFKTSAMANAIRERRRSYEGDFILIDMAYEFMNLID